MPNKIVTLLYNGLCSFEFGIAAEIFGLARPEILAEMGPESEGKWYDFKSVSLEEGPLKAAGGLQFTSTGTEFDLEQADTIIIPGWRGHDEKIPDTIRKALIKAHERGCRIVSICSGVYVLAATGLIDNKHVTTHWRYAKDFSIQYPHIRLEPNRLYIDEGDIMTSAGSSAGIDLCLHIVRKDFGVKIANSVARRLVMHAHRQGGQAQYIDQPIPVENGAHRLTSLLDYIRENLEAVHDISSLAQHSGMSLRTLQRRFSSLTGMPIGRWIQQERLTRARTLLETTKLSIEGVALAVGIQNVDTMRYHFRKVFGVSPGQYRKSFSEK